MPQIYKHQCVKPGCGQSYEDTDPDPYYCPSCVEQKKVIAKTIDEKLAAKSHKPVVSDLQRYDQLKNKSGYVPFSAL